MIPDIAYSLNRYPGQSNQCWSEISGRSKNPMICTALIEGLIWSLLWIIYVYLLVVRYPWEMLHDYPEDIQKASTLPKQTSAQKRNAKTFNIFASLIIFGVLIAFGLHWFSAKPASFLNVFCYIFIIAMSWNVIDLLVMDWLIICQITPKWVVIPGTEGCRGYHDYGYHFKGFLIGCVYTTILSLIIAGIDFAVLRFIIW